MTDTMFVHVTSRRMGRQTLFFDERDYLRLLKHLATAIERFGWRCHSYCLMPNHFHLLLELTALNLGRGMLLLNGAYARYFNWRHELQGHVFERKYHAEPIEKEEHLLATFRYIARNPVKAGLCERPQDWPWSSHRATAGIDPRPAWLTTDFTQRALAPYGGYVDFCNQIAEELQSDCRCDC